MHDPITFETRLADAFDRYVVPAPVDVDSVELVGTLTLGRRDRLGWRFPSPWAASARTRLAVGVGLLALATLLGAVLVGALLRPNLVSLEDGRILVWLSTDERGGKAWRLDPHGTVVDSHELFTRGGGCPTLVGTADALAFNVFGSRGPQLSVWSPRDGRRAELSTSYPGFERWSPNRDALAMVNMVDGPVKIVRFPTFDVAHPVTTAYPIAGVQEVVFSADGSRLALARLGERPADPGQLDDRVLIDVVDGDGYHDLTSRPTRNGPMPLLWAGDEGSLALVWIDVDGAHLEVVGPDSSVKELGRPPVLGAAEGMVPLAASPDGRRILVASSRGLLAIVDTTTGSWRVTMTGTSSGPVSARWSSDASRPSVAVLDGTRLVVIDAEGRVVRETTLPGTESAFSPDGDHIATLQTGARPADASVVWITDLRGSSAPREVAMLSPGDVPVPLDSRRARCIQWVPDVTQ